jgi:hypothetical protein
LLYQSKVMLLSYSTRRPEAARGDERSRTMNYFYLLFMIAITICIHNSIFLDECTYAVGTYFIVDFAFMRRLKTDKLFHHIFAMCIIVFFHIYAYPVTYDLKEKVFLMKSVLSVETSSIFLTANYLLDENANTVIVYANYVAFVTTFLYYRIYSYYVNVISRYETNHFIISVSKNGYHTICVYIGIYGLFALNLYWIPVIAQYIIRRHQKRIQRPDETKKMH